MEEEKKMDEEKNTDEQKAKEIQRKYLELQLLDQQVKQVQRQVQAIELQLSELSMVQASLDDFAAAKPGSEAFVTVTPGILARSELKDNRNVFMNIGSGVVVQKTIPEAKEIIAAQSAELRKLHNDLVVQFERLTAQAGKAEEELRAFVG